MKSTVKINERITIEIEYTTDIITRMPCGFEPMEVEELYENIKYRCYNPSNKIFASNCLKFISIADISNPVSYHYDARIANAYKNRNDVDYVCRMEQDVIGLSTPEKKRIEQAIVELKYAELKENNHFEIKQNLMIKELNAELEGYKNTVKNAELEIKRNGFLRTEKEINEYTYRYNNIYNEGYQEPLPITMISKEAYSYAKAETEKISSKIAEIKTGILW